MSHENISSKVRDIELRLRHNGTVLTRSIGANPFLFVITDHSIMDILGLGSKIETDFILDPHGQRKQIEVKLDETKRSLQYIYYDGEDVSGTVGNIDDFEKIISRDFNLVTNQIEEKQ